MALDPREWLKQRQGGTAVADRKPAARPSFLDPHKFVKDIISRQRSAKDDFSRFGEKGAVFSREVKPEEKERRLQSRLPAKVEGLGEVTDKFGVTHKNVRRVTEPTGRQYLLSGEGKPVVTERGTTSEQVKRIRGGSYQDLGTEVDHLIPKSLGGTDTDTNLKARKSPRSKMQKAEAWLKGLVGIKTERPKTGELPRELRQEGKMVVEHEAQEQYRAGKISLPQARAAVVHFDKPELVNDILGKEVKKPSRGIFSKVTDVARRITPTITPGQLAPEAEIVTSSVKDFLERKKSEGAFRINPNIKFRPSAESAKQALSETGEFAADVPKIIPEIVGDTVRFAAEAGLEKLPTITKPLIKTQRLLAEAWDPTDGNKIKEAVSELLLGPEELKKISSSESFYGQATRWMAKKLKEKGFTPDKASNRALTGILIAGALIENPLLGPGKKAAKETIERSMKEILEKEMGRRLTKQEADHVATKTIDIANLEKSERAAAMGEIIASIKQGVPSASRKDAQALPGTAKLGDEAADASESALAAEARKYKSADEFIQAKTPKRLHGAAAPIKKVSGVEDFYSPTNIYGQGFYTTDSVDIATGYARRRGATKPTLYEVVPKKGARLFDLESDLSKFPDIKKELTEGSDSLQNKVFEENKTLRDAMDEFRDMSSAGEMPVDTVQDIFLQVRDVLEKKGYKGLRHTGGRLTGNKPHEVEIYWDPKDVKTKELPFTSRKDLEDTFNQAKRGSETAPDAPGGIQTRPRPDLAREAPVRQPDEASRGLGRAVETEGPAPTPAQAKVIDTMRREAQRSEKEVRFMVGRLSDIIEKGKRSADDGGGIKKAGRRVETLKKSADIRKLRNDIFREISWSVARRKSGIPRGRLTPETQDALDKIRQAMKLDRPTAMENAGKLAAPYADGAHMPPEVARQIDALRAGGGFMELNKQELEFLAENVKSLRETGRTVNELRAFNRQTEMQQIRETAIEALTGGKPVADTAKALGTKEPFGRFRAPFRALDNMLHGVDTLLDKISVFDKTNTGKLDGFLNRKMGDMVHASRQVQNAGEREWTDFVQEGFSKIWDTTSPRELARIVNQNKTPSVSISTQVGEETVTRKFSPNQVYKKWMELQDPTLEKTFREGMGWDDGTIRSINQYMDSNPKLKAWAEWQLKEFYPKYGETVQPVFESAFNVPFPMRPNYSPIKRSGIDRFTGPEALLLDDAAGKATTRPGGLKQRTANVKPLDWTDGDEVLTRHIVDMEHFKAFDETVRNWRSVFGDAEVRTAITERHGGDVLPNIDHLIDNIARDGADKAASLNLLDKQRGRFTRAVLGLNPTITIKQLSSIPAYITEMPGGAAKGAADFFKYEVDFWKNPIKNAKTLMSSEMMKARYKNIDRDIRLLMKQKVPEQVLAGKRGFLDRLLINVRMGDKGAILQGGWAVYKSNYDSLIKGGMSKKKAHAEALKIFERATVRTQQAGEVENLARLQTMGGSFGKLFTMFLTSPNQYYRITSRSYRNLRYGVGSPATNVRNFAIAWAVLPSIFQYIADGFRVDPERQKRAILLGPLNGIPVAGEMISGLTRGLAGDDVFDASAPGPLTLGSESGRLIQKSISDFDAETVTSEDIWEYIKDAGEIAGQVVGLPIGPATDLTVGAAHVAGGEDPRRLIFSDYALDIDRTVTGEAEKLDEELQKLPKEEANARFRELKEENPSLHRALKRVIRDRKLGITEDDKQLRDLGVENGERARVIHKRAMDLDTREERNAMVRELARKRVVTPDVMKQLKKLAAQDQ